MNASLFSTDAGVAIEAALRFVEALEIGTAEAFSEVLDPFQISIESAAAALTVDLSAQRAQAVAEGIAAASAIFGRAAAFPLLAALALALNRIAQLEHIGFAEAGARVLHGQNQGETS